MRAADAHALVVVELRRLVQLAIGAPAGVTHGIGLALRLRRRGVAAAARAPGRDVGAALLVEQVLALALLLVGLEWGGSLADLAAGERGALACALALALLERGGAGLALLRAVRVHAANQALEDGVLLPLLDDAGALGQDALALDFVLGHDFGLVFLGVELPLDGEERADFIIVGAGAGRFRHGGGFGIRCGSTAKIRHDEINSSKIRLGDV